MTMLACTTDICTYPSAIARACAALDESPAFRDLPDGYLRVVVRLIKKINLSRLFSPIVASRGTIARESGKSIETVGRAVKWLEDQQLVTREQRARAGLRGSSAPLVPTAKFIDALTLRQTVSVPSAASAVLGVPAEACSDSAADKVATLLKAALVEPEPVMDPINSPADPAPVPLVRDLVEPVADAGYPQDTRESPVTPDASKSTGQGLQQSYQRQPEIQESTEKPLKVGKFRIPSDLAWLIQEQNLAPTGLLALMAQARKAGQRLSDVVALTRRYLVKLSGRRLYAYLSTLLRQGKDYGFIRARQDDEQRMSEDAAHDAQRLAVKAVDWVGRTFSTLDGAGSITVEVGGWLRVCRPGRCGGMVWGTRRMDVEFVRLVDREMLRILV